MPPGVGQLFQTGGYVDTVPIDVVLIDDYVSQVDANSERDVFSRRRYLGKRSLNGYCASDSVDDAGKFY